MENENASSAKFLPSLSSREVTGTPAFRRNPRQTQRCYKPTSTRVPFLCFVLLVALALIALVEVACHRYPVQNESSLLGFNLSRRALDDGAEVEDRDRSGFDLIKNIDIRNPINPAVTPEYRPSSAFNPDGPSVAISSATGLGNAVSVAVNLRPSSAFNPDQPSRTKGAAYSVESAYDPVVSSTSPETHLVTLTTTPDAYNPTDPPQKPVTSVTPDGQPLPTRTTIPGAYNPTDPPSVPTGPAVTITATPQAGHPSAYNPGSIQGLQPQSAYNPESAQSAAQSDYNPESAVPTAQQSAYNVPGSGLPPAQQSASNPGSAVPSAQQSAYNQPGASPGQQTGHNPPTSGPGSNEDPKAAPLVPVSTYTTGGYVVVEMGTTTAPSYVPVSTYTTDGYAMVVMGTLPSTQLVPVSTVTSDGVAVVIMGHPTSSPTGTALPQSAASDYVVVEPIVATSGTLVYTYTSTMTIHGTKATGTGATQALALATGGAVNQKTSCTATTVEDITNYKFVPMNYFTAAYVPTLVAVAFRILWTLVYNNARLMEPFYRLASPAGASGRHFLEMLYLSMDDFIPEPFPSLLSGHSYMLLVSSIAALTQVLTPLCAEFLSVDMTHGVIRGDGLDPNHPCAAQTVIRYLPARILQGLLGAIALAIVFTMILSWNRPSGVYSDPSSIAVMASLLHHPEVVDQFKTLGRHAGDEAITRVASEQAYKLGYYQTADGMKYGVLPVLQMTKSKTRTSNTYTPVLNPGTVAASQKVNLRLWRHTWRTVGDCVLAVLLLGVLGVVAAYYKDDKDDGFNRFFNSQTFGPKFLLVLASGVIVSQWKRIEREVRTLQPYRQLASSSASSPTHTILQVTTATPWTTFPLALIQREFFIALVSFCYLLSEILVIVVATVPFSASEYWIEYLAGTYICFSILGLQMLTFGAFIFWWRRTCPRLERDPDTTLGVWTLLANSGLRHDFEDMSTAGRKDLVASVKAWRKRYWMGMVLGKDGASHLGIYDDVVMFPHDPSVPYAPSDREREFDRESGSDAASSRYEPT